MKRQPQFVREAEPHEWVERKPRRYILFGPQQHFWALWTRGSYSSEVTRVSPERYEQLLGMQGAVPCRLGEATLGEARSKEWHQFFLYWYRDRWYYVAQEFTPQELIPLINKYHDDFRAAKAEKEQKRLAAIQQVKQQISRKA
jgi:hypothetical protein